MIMQENTLNDTNTQTNSINCNVTSLFPTPILQFDHIEGYETLLDDAYALKRQSVEGIKASNQGGWHSPLVPIPKLILPYIPFPKYDGVAWYMINTNLQGNYAHQHPRNDWAGVLWLKIPDEEAHLEFEHPDCFGQYGAIDSIRVYHPHIQQEFNYYQAYAFPPKEGRMLIFPAALRHRVHYSKTDEERVAISFNLKLPIL